MQSPIGHIWMQARWGSVTWRQIPSGGWRRSLNGALMKRIVFASVAAAMSVTAGLPATATPRWANAQPVHVYDYDQGYGRDRRTSFVAPNADTNSCLEGSVIGCLLGAGPRCALPGQICHGSASLWGCGRCPDRLSGGWGLTSGIGRRRLTAAFWRLWHDPLWSFGDLWTSG